MSLIIIFAIAAAFALPHVFAYGRDRDGRWLNIAFAKMAGSHRMARGNIMTCIQTIMTRMRRRGAGNPRREKFFTLKAAT